MSTNITLYRPQAALACFAIILLLMAGCATSPSSAPQARYPDETERSQIGHLAVICSQAAPPIAIEPAVSGKGSSAAKGAGSAVGGLWNSCLSGADDGLALIFCTALTPFFAIGGTVYGGVTAPSQKEITAGRQSIDAALAELDVQGRLNDQTLQIARENWPFQVTVASSPGPTSLEEHPDYSDLASEGINTVLEVAMTRLRSENNGGVHPPIFIVLEAKARLISVSSGREIYLGTHTYVSRGRHFEEWTENNAAHFRETLELAYHNLATNIVEQSLLIYPIYQTSLSTQAGRGDSLKAISQTSSPLGLRPIYPVNRSFLSRKIKIDSLRPTLRWEAFPRSVDLTDPASPLVRAHNIRYELRIGRASDDFDDNHAIELVYQNNDLAEPQYTLEQPLEPGKRYFWSVRARFELDGLTRLTPWSTENPQTENITPVPSRYSLQFYTK